MYFPSGVRYITLISYPVSLKANSTSFSPCPLFLQCLHQRSWAFWSISRGYFSCHLWSKAWASKWWWELLLLIPNIPHKLENQKQLSLEVTLDECPSWALHVKVALHDTVGLGKYICPVSWRLPSKISIFFPSSRPGHQRRGAHCEGHCPQESVSFFYVAGQPRDLGKSPTQKGSCENF